jgi:hypothetical protein
MKRYAISGSWRKTNAAVEADVRQAVREVMTDGDAIVTGGALDVDFFAVDEALKMDPLAERVLVLLPVAFDTYEAYLREDAATGLATGEQVEELLHQLVQLRAVNPAALVEGPIDAIVDQASCFARNTDIIGAADELFAFQVDGSAGVQDAVDKARAQRKPVRVWQYEI